MIVWAPVLGYEGLYEVSAFGDVRSLDRTKRTTRGLQRWPGRIMSRYVDSNGYLYVNLSKDSRAKKCAVHRIVLEAFVGSCPDGFEACHNNGVRTDCAVGNLRWGSRRENAMDRGLHGTQLRGEKSPKARLSVEQVRLIRESTETSIKLGAMLGVASSTVRAVRIGQNWNYS